MNKCDDKWTNALSAYVGGEVLAYYKHTDGSVDVPKTVDSMMRMLAIRKPDDTMPHPVPMTTEQLRTRVLELIGQWLQNDKVQASEPAMRVLNALAGDIQVINLG